MTWLIGLAHVLSLGSLALLFLAVGSSIARRWSLALRAARVCALVALGLVVGCDREGGNTIEPRAWQVGDDDEANSKVSQAAGNPTDPFDGCRLGEQRRDLVPKACGIERTDLLCRDKLLDPSDPRTLGRLLATVLRRVAKVHDKHGIVADLRDPQERAHCAF